MLLEDLMGNRFQEQLPEGTQKTVLHLTMVILDEQQLA